MTHLATPKVTVNYGRQPRLTVYTDYPGADGLELFLDTRTATLLLLIAGGPRSPLELYALAAVAVELQAVLEQACCPNPGLRVPPELEDSTTMDALSALMIARSLLGEAVEPGTIPASDEQPYDRNGLHEAYCQLAWVAQAAAAATTSVSA